MGIISDMGVDLEFNPETRCPRWILNHEC